MSARVWEPVEALDVSDPLATVVLRVKLAGESPFKPDPPSWAVQFRVTLAPCQAVSVASQVNVGALRSTLIPEYGPAVVEFPTASVRAWEPVEALDVSDPLATVLLRVKLAGEDPFKPDPPSWAVQFRATLAPCQARSAAPHANMGALRA